MNSALDGLPADPSLDDTEPHGVLTPMVAMGPEGDAIADPLAAGATALGARVRVVPARARLLAGLLVWDALTPVAAVGVAGRLAGSGGVQVGNAAGRMAALLALLSPIALALAGAYDHGRRRAASRVVSALRLVVVGLLLSWAGALAYSVEGRTTRPTELVAVALLLPAGWLIGRWACDRHPAIAVERILLVGAGVQADRLVSLARRHRERRLDIVGRVEIAGGPAGAADGPPLLGDLEDLPHIAQAHSVDRVLVAFAPRRDGELVELLRECVGRGIEVDVIPRFFDLVGPSPRAHSLGGVPLLEVPGRGLNPAQRAVKRAVDIAGAGLLLLLMAPLLLLVAAVVAIADGRPVLYRQWRVGRHGAGFWILKFRTMRAAPEPAEAAGEGIAAAVRRIKADGCGRVTRTGGLLRRTSLDELPQLVNVLIGDMSLIGPRPLRPFEVESLERWQLSRQELRPGLTGLWQVLGRSEVDWEERIQLDYSYVSHWSLIADLRILARTLPAVLRRDGAV